MREKKKTSHAKSGLENSFPKSCNKRNKFPIKLGQHLFCLFGSVVVVVFQSVFHAEIKCIKIIFLFLKNYF